MPNCFQLFLKGSSEPVSLNKIDEELCQLLGKPVHFKQYVVMWYDVIGWTIAVNGYALGSKELREKVEEYDKLMDEDQGALIKCLDYLEENYTSTAFYQSKSNSNG
jgi:hypothetical protein